MNEMDSVGPVLRCASIRVAIVVLQVVNILDHAHNISNMVSKLVWLLQTRLTLIPILKMVTLIEKPYLPWTW